MLNAKNPITLPLRDHTGTSSSSTPPRKTLSQIKQTLVATFSRRHHDASHNSEIKHAATQKMASTRDSGSTRFIAAKRALHHLQENLSQIEEIFAEFRISKYDYHPLAGFDENMIPQLVEEIHILVYTKPPDALLRRLAPVLLPFPAVIVTETSVHRLQLSAAATTASPSFSLSTNVDAGGSLNIGGSGSGQSGGGGHQGTRKGKEQEQPEKNGPPDSAEEDGGLGNPEPNPDSPDIKGSWNASITFDIVTRLHDRSRPQDPSLQSLLLRGSLATERTSETHQPPQFATCRVEFTELKTFTKTPIRTVGDNKATPTYRLLHLDVSVDSHQEVAEVSDIRPERTQKYHDESKIITREQATSTEKTTTLSRITQLAMSGKAEWGFSIADPFDQQTGVNFSSEKLPRAHFEFIGTTDVPAPPPTCIDVEISTFWSLQLPRSGRKAGLLSRFLRRFRGTRQPRYSNICKTVQLKIPSDLQGSKMYKSTLKAYVNSDLNDTQRVDATQLLLNTIPSDLVTPRVTQSNRVFEDSDT